MNFILLFLLGHLAYASELSVCNDFVKNLQTGAFSEAPAAAGEDHPYHFVQDEQKALHYINTYQVSKLNIPFGIKVQKSMISDCKKLMNKDYSDQFCQYQIPNYQFLKALVYGMKSYGWKPATIQTGKQKLTDYLKVVSREQTSLLDVALASTLLSYYVSQFPSKSVPFNQAEGLKKKVDDEIKTIGDKFKGKTTTCSQIQEVITAERKAAKSLRKNLNKIVSAL